MMPSSTSTQPSQPQRKTALVLAGGGITGFLFEVGVLTALDELAGRALSNDFDVYVGTSAGAVLAALLANGAHAAEIFAAMTQNEAGSPFYFESRDILGVGSGGPLRMMGQFARATFGTLGRALGPNNGPRLHRCLRTFRSIIRPASIRPKLSIRRSATDFQCLGTATSSTSSRGNSLLPGRTSIPASIWFSARVSSQIRTFAVRSPPHAQSLCSSVRSASAM